MAEDTQVDQPAEAIDAPADTTATEEAPQPDETGEPKQDAAEAAEPAETKPDSRDELAKIEIPEPARKEIGRMAKALANLQAENAALKADSVTKSDQAKPAKPKGDDHPALAGLTPDDDGEYLVNDRYMTRQEVIDAYDSKQDTADVRARLERLEQARDNDKREAEFNKTVTELHEHITSNVKSLRAEHFAEVPADKVAAFDNSLLRNVYSLVEEKTTEGAELSEALLTEAISQAFAEHRELMGILGAAQVANNDKTKSQHPVAPGGTPGAEAAKDPLSLPQRIAHGMADKAAKLAEAMRPK